MLALNTKLALKLQICREFKRKYVTILFTFLTFHKTSQF